MAEMSDIFRLMNDWRCLPKYQLERRADIFFGWYLPQIWAGFSFPGGEHHFIEHCNIIPEFPIKKNVKNHRTSNIDYVIFCKEAKRVYFVELKTDINSYKSSLNDKESGQYELMKKHTNIESLIEGARAVAGNPARSTKYQKLLTMIDENYNGIGYTERAQICYIAPCRLDLILEKERLSAYDNLIQITFDDIIDILWKETDDALAQAFCIALGRCKTPCR